MAEFVTDFIQSDTTYMVLKNKLNPEAGTLNRIQVKMLAASSVPHVLDLHVREVDTDTELHYDIGGKRMLSACLRTEKITLVEYYALLLQIVTALEYGMTYMLNPHRFLLKEDYMFVDGPLAEGIVYLTYVPLDESAGAAPIRERIGSLAARWMTAVDDLRGNGIQHVLQMCEQPSFSLQTLKSLLIGLLTESGKSPAGDLEAYGPSMHPASFRAGGSEAAGGGGNAGRSASQAAWPQHGEGRAGVLAAPDLAASYAEPAAAFSGESFRSLPSDSALQGPETERKRSENGSSGRLIAPLIAGLLLAALWKLLYLDHPGRVSLLVCVVAAPPLLLFAYAGWAGKVKFGGRRAERRQEEEEAEALASAWQEPGRNPGPRPFYGQREQAVDGSSGAGERIMQNRDTQNRDMRTESAEGRNIPDFLHPGYAGSSSSGDVPEAAGAPSYADCGTGVLGTPAAQPTVILDSGRTPAGRGGASASADPGPRYRLERIENGILPQSIPLPAGPFTIGRAADVSQHVETAAGISRAHVELELYEGMYTIKDIGSRNGTTLNEETLIPYKAYELREGDTFRLAGISYTLKSG
ncbi:MULTISPECIES: DUF6382 domain-containing protein [Saccharibacillus]|uniref:DUF6382 domain-containing protein n=1 Tax=Saccharibacillus TaxID=456492 RepID=UPI001238FCC3|nr:DUF6382 domain-containing protein [Saccharibacillus sp. WB 17]MWJ30697.1 FHA domain-containing protein [Saccharibacillus sp. WB 17]